MKNISLVCTENHGFNKYRWLVLLYLCFLRPVYDYTAPNLWRPLPAKQRTVSQIGYSGRWQYLFVNVISTDTIKQRMNQSNLLGKFTHICKKMLFLIAFFLFVYNQAAWLLLFLFCLCLSLIWTSTHYIYYVFRVWLNYVLSLVDVSWLKIYMYIQKNINIR